MAKERDFPFAHDLTKDIRHYPEGLTVLTGDILEIGPGRGDLLLEKASEYRDKKFVAVEIGKKRFTKMIPRIEKKKLTNISLWGGDARLIVPQYAKAETFEQIMVLFPDPWPKDRHAFRRLLNLKFLWILANLLKPGGLFLHATDDEPYARWVMENLKQVPWLTNTLAPLEYTDTLPELTETFFEKKWKDMGRKLYFIRYKKIKLTTAQLN
ncbi:hypothetical protein K1X76_04710 [bacterium]|nr:hypothetical protein [bacterium]